MRKLKAKRWMSVVLAVVLCLQLRGQSVQAATELSGASITCYTLSTEKVTTYTAVDGAYSGYIEAGDQCKILEIYASGWVKVSYPVSWGTKEAYAKSTDFFVNPDFSLDKMKLGSSKKVYRKADMAKSIGTVYADDEVIVIGNRGSKTQILYPVSNGTGYKLGWIEGVYISEDYYRIKSAVNSNYVIDIYGASDQNRANVQLCRNNGGDNQIFYFKRVTGNYYTIMAKNSGKVFDVEKGSLQAGANIIQYSLNGEGSDNQLWELFVNGDSTYSFRSKLNGLFLDLYGGIAADESNIQCWGRNDTLAQKFILERVDKEPSTLYYKAYVAGQGWLSTVTDGLSAGTTGQSLALKAVIIQLEYGDESGITYRTHFTDVGWQDWKSSGEVSGLRNDPGAIEAIQIKLQNGMESKYDIYYRVHCADYGWLGWAKNGETAGTVGYAKRAEALEIKIVAKGTAFDVGGAASHEKSEGSATAQQKIEEIVNYELSQIGVGDYKGNNNVIYNTWYYGHTVNSSGYAWCQVFQSFGAEQCGVLGTAIPRESSCLRAIQWYKERGRFYLSQYYGGNYVPKAGDLVFYGTNGGNHVGMIVASPVSGYLQVVEGNVLSSSSGNYEVVKFTNNYKRTLTSSYVYGYASPDYGAAENTYAEADTWEYPMTNSYVCGNDWNTYYSARPSRPYHVGIDIASRSGDSTVYSAADGIVKKTGYNSANGYYIIVEHTINSKTVYSFYAHLKKGSFQVQQGDAVSKGKAMAVFGNTGSGSAGTHLHFAIVDTLWERGDYYGYVPYFSGNSVKYQNVTYYNPHYVVEHNALP